MMESGEMNGKEKKTGWKAIGAAKKDYMRNRTVLGITLSLLVIAGVVGAISYVRNALTREQIFATNRERMETVLIGLIDGGMEEEQLSAEYDQLYIAKLKNTQYYYRDFQKQPFNDAFARSVGEYAGIDSVAVIDEAGTVYASWQCDYDFSRNRFNMLRACSQDDGISEPFNIRYENGTRRFFGKKITDDRILVFAVDWTETGNNIREMTSWEAVLRGMVSVDTYTIAVSLTDYSFLYNPIDDLTGKDALQNGVPIEALGDSYEGVLQFGGESWCVVGQKWNDAVVFVMTRANTQLASDTILLSFMSIIFIMFLGLVSAYGIIINRDNIRVGKLPSYITLIRNRLYFNLTVAGKLFPLVLAGTLAMGGMCFYIQSVNSLSAIAYESNQAIEKIGEKLDANVSDAKIVNEEYKELFLNKCELISQMLEKNPQYVLDFDKTDENVHQHPTEKDASGQVISGLDSYGNVSYAISDSPFLQKICEINAIKKLSLFDEYGRILATNDDGWYSVLTDDPESGDYPFWEILADHRDFVAQDMEYDDEGGLAQYIGSAFYYYTVQNSDGSTRYVSRDDYQSQLNGTWKGQPIERHRGMLQIGIVPERLMTVMETASVAYVAHHTSIHGTGFTIICDTSDQHICLYYPRVSEIGKTALSMGYSADAFIETGELYNGFETVNGDRYFQTFKLADNFYIGTSVPMETVYAGRLDITLAVLIAVMVGILIIFVYTCIFGQKEENMYRQNVSDAEHRARNEQDVITVTMPSGKTRKVRSAASRWDPEYIPWKLKTPEQKFSMIASIVFHIFAVFLFVCILVSRSGIFPIDAINYVFEGVWSKGVNIFALTNCAITLIMVFVVANAIELIIENVSVNIGSRAETLGHLIVSVIQYGVALFALFYTLYLCGLDTGSLIASAGILSLIVGLGAQSMIQDILAGVFIVFEGEFRVGDIVTVGDFRGNVLEIGLRTTKIQDTSKNIKVFNNSSLSGIINMTKEASFAGVDVGIEYGESIERVEAILKEELPKIRKRIRTIMDGPYYKGVSALGDSGVVIKIIALCKEQDRMQLCRDLNREILLIFNKYGINIPFPQLTVSSLKENTEPPSEEERREARRFVKEQKEISRDINMEEKDEESDRNS